MKGGEDEGRGKKLGEGRLREGGVNKVEGDVTNSAPAHVKCASLSFIYTYL